MAKVAWQQKRDELQAKISKTVKDCYVEFLKDGGDPAQCAGCPLGPECQRYNATTRKARVQMTIEIIDRTLLDRNASISFLEKEIKQAIEMSHAVEVEKIRLIDTWWL